MQPLWPHQQRGLDETTAAIMAGKTRIALTSPTGGGKTFLLINLCLWAAERGWRVVWYTNKRPLLEQTQGVFDRYGLDYGTRAAGYRTDLAKSLQIASLPTEVSRVLKRVERDVHPAELVLIDEAHLQKEKSARAIIDRHLSQGAAVIGVTATPVGIEAIYDTLIVAGTNSELRQCGALLRADVYSPTEPDLRQVALVKRKNHEFSRDELLKTMPTKYLWGYVYEHWKQYNPDAKATILFAPGVPESLDYAKMFEANEIPAAHIDGDIIYRDGVTMPSTTENRQQLIADVKAGVIRVVCNRFVLREGIDIPHIYHGILATAFGSITTYVQSVGRILRAHDSLDHVVIQDHGGNVIRHGSPNADREWVLDYTESQYEALRAAKMRDDKIPEPITCPKCFAVRLPHHPYCHKCGHVAAKYSRRVIELNGTLSLVEGKKYKARKRIEKPNSDRVWKSTYERAKRAGLTFAQAEGLFVKENHYWPPRDLPFMPTTEIDWHRKVRDVPHDRLTYKGEKSAQKSFV